MKSVIASISCAVLGGNAILANALIDGPVPNRSCIILPSPDSLEINTQSHIQMFTGDVVPANFEPLAGGKNVTVYEDAWAIVTVDWGKYQSLDDVLTRTEITCKLGGVQQTSLQIDAHNLCVPQAAMFTSFMALRSSTPPQAPQEDKNGFTADENLIGCKRETGGHVTYALDANCVLNSKHVFQGMRIRIRAPEEVLDSSQCSSSGKCVIAPTARPTTSPTKSPTRSPTTSKPTAFPTTSPTRSPTTSKPTTSPTRSPTGAPTMHKHADMKCHIHGDPHVLPFFQMTKSEQLQIYQCKDTTKLPVLYKAKDFEVFANLTAMFPNNRPALYVTELAIQHNNESTWIRAEHNKAFDKWFHLEDGRVEVQATSVALDDSFYYNVTVVRFLYGVEEPRDARVIMLEHHEKGACMAVGGACEVPPPQFRTP
eukprot:CAMPEP_0203763548 /NCGR_PEP_ID=MMETSP0098-20131031/16379_1 /ASSEMBLY_ACC=CAM_ASM_000208 /TAXON_ID=96639 /ORGANISM=" , Strain NY0313808BC1" /LENGTH=425 /DNA_ID=CAMNT_0050658477 /DNA_START=1035 /DNA_END=2309 /DNA_ORIENTATION=+